MAGVLVVDDDSDYRLLVRLSLARHGGFTVAGEASDGPGAVAMAQQTEPDIIVANASSPGVLESLPELCSIRPDACTVLVSSYPDTELRQAAHLTQAVGWLSKALPARSLGEELATLTGLIEQVSSTLAEHSREAAIRLRRHPSEAGTARRFVDDAVGPDADIELRDTLALLTTELVANAILHTDSDPDVTVRLWPDSVRVEVGDRSSVRPVPRYPDPLATSGRGLALVETLSTRWGIDGRRDGGKVIWFELSRRPSQVAG